jgi:hypothetical protein
MGVYASDMPELTRRRAILGAMSASAAALAGCLVEGDGNDDSAGDDTDDSDDSNDDDSNNDDETNAALSDTTLIHRYSDCADGDGGAAVVQDGASYVVDGLAMAPDPCHEPALRDADFEDGDLMVSVDIAQRELGEDEVCMDCQGAVAYDALAEMSEADAVERVLVSHGDQEYELLSDEFSTDPYVYATDIETTEADCGAEGIDEADATLENGTLTVTGRRSTSNPCHRAQIEDVSVVGGELNVEVSFVAYEHDDEDGIGGCVACIGEVAYEASVEVLNAEVVEEVVVDHAGGERHKF